MFQVFVAMVEDVYSQRCIVDQVYMASLREEVVRHYVKWKLILVAICCFVGWCNCLVLFFRGNFRDDNG